MPAQLSVVKLFPYSFFCIFPYSDIFATIFWDISKMGFYENGIFKNGIY